MTVGEAMEIVARTPFKVVASVITEPFRDHPMELREAVEILSKKSEVLKPTIPQPPKET